MNAEEVAKQTIFWGLCRNGQLDDLIKFFQDDLIPTWRTRYQTKKTRGGSAKKRDREEDEIDTEVPWLRKERKLESESLTVEGATAELGRIDGGSTAEKGLTDGGSTAEKGPTYEGLPAETGPTHEGVTAEKGPTHEGSTAEIGDSHEGITAEVGSAEQADARVKERRARSVLAGLCLSDDPKETTFLERRLRYFCNTKDKLKRNGLQLSASAGNCDLIRCLSRALNDNEPLISIRSTAQDGMQALHFAVLSMNLDAVKECIKSGAKVNCAYGRAKKTPLFLADKKQACDIAEYLRSKGGRLKDDQDAMEADQEFQAVLQKIGTGNQKNANE